MTGAAHERADWMNHGRTLADRLARYLNPERYDHGEPTIWGEDTVQDIADTIEDYRREHTRRARGAADSVPEPEAPAHYPSAVYALSLVDERRDRWDILRDGERITTLSLDGTEDFLRAIDAGATEAEAARAAHAADMARSRRNS